MTFLRERDFESPHTNLSLPKVTLINLTYLQNYLEPTKSKQ